MKHLLRIFLGDECGQDLIEYTLLVAFVALTSAGLFLGSGANVEQVWSSANTVLSSAADAQNPPSNTGGTVAADRKEADPATAGTMAATMVTTKPDHGLALQALESVFRTYNSESIN